MTGEGKAASIQQEARAMSETLKLLGESIEIAPDGSFKQDAMNLRIAEQYVRVMHEIYSTADIVILPTKTRDELNSGNPLSPSSLATAFTLYKRMISDKSEQVPSIQ